jgi:hypothetical protein
MMRSMNPTALAIAAAYAILAFVPLAWRRFGRPWVYVCLVAGALVSPIAREGVQIVWDEIGRYTTETRTSPAASVAHLVLVALVGELVKVVVPVAGVLFREQTDEQTATAYGAAAGAGFGFMSTQSVLAIALGLVGSPYITALSSTAAIVGWFFPILAHVATTAIVTRSAVHGRFIATFLAMWVIQFGLGLAQRLPVVGGVSTGLALTAVVSIVLLLIARRVGPRPSVPTPAEA